MKHTFRVSISKEGDWYVAQCLEIDVASQGETKDEALVNLGEAIMLHFTPPVATAVPKVRSIEVEIDHAPPAHAGSPALVVKTRSGTQGVGGDRRLLPLPLAAITKIAGEPTSLTHVCSQGWQMVCRRDCR